jgi:hypothetical protein
MWNLKEYLNRMLGQNFVSADEIYDRDDYGSSRIFKILLREEISTELEITIELELEDVFKSDLVVVNFDVV